MAAHDALIPVDLKIRKMNRSPQVNRVLNRVAVAAFLSLTAVQAGATSLHEAAERALQQDPRLAAAHLSATGSAAEVEAARAGYLPSVNASVIGGRSRLYSDAQFPQAGARQPLSWGLVASQPLYSGGLVSAQVDAARSKHEGAEQNEAATAQQLLFAAASAWLDVKRDRAVIGLNETNVQRLQQALDDSRKRLDAGEATKADVAQAEARLAEAGATLYRARATESVSAASYERVVGVPPDQLPGDWPKPLVPATLAEALAVSADTPAVRAADAEDRAAKSRISAEQAGHLPRLSIEAEANDADDSTFTYDRQTYWSVQLKATLPIYAGGAVASRVSAAKAEASAAAARAADSRRASSESIAQAWAMYQSSAQVIAAYEASVKASELALDSVQREQAVGTRTTLDLLDAQRELLTATVNLAASQHDRSLAALQLLGATGRLTLAAIP